MLRFPLDGLLDEQACYDFLLRLLHPDGLHCPRGHQLGADQAPHRRPDWYCNVAITWTRASAKCPAELCVVMTNLHADGWVLRHYLKRMHMKKASVTRNLVASIWNPRI